MSEKPGIVYCAMCTTSKKKYVEKTGNTLEERWNQHIKMAENGSNLPLHQALRRHGADRFILKILDHITEDKLDEREEHWIAKGNTRLNGYNITPNEKRFEGIRQNKVKHILELWELGWDINNIALEMDSTVQEVRQYLGQNMINEEVYQNRQLNCIHDLIMQSSIAQINPGTGEIVKIYNNANKAAELVGSAALSLIRGACSGKQPVLSGHYWRLTSDLTEEEQLLKQYTGRLPERHEASAATLKEINRIKVAKLWEDGHNCTQIAETVGCSRVTAQRILEGLGVSSEERVERGYSDRGKVVLQIDENGKVLREYNSASEAAIMMGCVRQAIGQACRKGTKSGNFYWKYAENESQSTEGGVTECV